MTNKGKVCFGKPKTQQENPWAELQKHPGVKIIEIASK
jgi:hypothetical protein